MDSASYQKVEEIYYQVLDNKPDDIKAYIAEKANGDAQIVDKVMSLLAVGDYKTYNKTANNVMANLSEIISDHSGGFESERYQLLEKIGEGGMGSVYLAKRIDEEVEHKVAIKLINTALSSNANIERFKKERQILASLDHENIARFIDAGTTDAGVLYVVMEYIEGISIKQYCLQNKLPIKQKFTLFLQLCNAIDYAHKNFIIHRDIKPTNILVNKEGKVKLLDFGIAKLIDEDAQQMVATVTKIMTPAYASPEQLLGKKITVQSDIYTLGIVLFEIIIGCRPYQKHEADSHSFQLKVINGINTKPSHLLDDLGDQQKVLSHKHVLKGDIDALLTKVIHPDTKHRYETVYELKSDISNYLHGFPVKARKANSWYFLRLFIKRNKLIATLSSISLAIIIGFSVYSYLQN
ncbi:MAG: serine/threonine protein kinase [Alcanivoracaceae bacterium]|nr:serine/threonine protein kinase [Alcanivoracaceae bacterium]